MPAPFPLTLLTKQVLRAEGIYFANSDCRSDGEDGQLANKSGFSLHAGVFANTDEPDKLERLCRCISRPGISEQRLSMTQHGQVRYELNTQRTGTGPPYGDGTTHVFFSPIDFIGKLAALIPPPRLKLTRFFGVFAPNSNLRAQDTASQRGKNSPRLVNIEDGHSDKPYHARGMTWPSAYGEYST